MKFSLRRQSSGKAYPYIAQVSPLMLRVFMRKIYLHNSKGVPTDKPVLLAANHPTAFLDPVLLCSFLPPPLYNMTRGDIFKKPFFRQLMENINMFPVFRVRDGYTGRDRNDEVFEFCRRKLLEKRVVTIYVEGEHHLEWRVRPLQKGIARIAFDTLAKHELSDLQIVPAGCNYLYGDRARDEAMIVIGEPLPLQPYWEQYRHDPNAAMIRLMADLDVALKKVCLHVEDSADLPLAAQLLTLNRSKNPPALVPVVEYHDRRFRGEKVVCDRLNALPAGDKSVLRERAGRYFDALEAAGLTDEALMNPHWAAWWRLPLFAAGFIPFFAGFLGVYPVIGLSRWVARKTVKKREFYSSVQMGVGFLGGSLYYALIFLASLFTRNPWCISLALALPVLGWFSMVYREGWMRWTQARKALRHPERVRLSAMRSDIPIL